MKLSAFRLPQPSNSPLLQKTSTSVRYARSNEFQYSANPVRFSGAGNSMALLFSGITAGMISLAAGLTEIGRITSPERIATSESDKANKAKRGIIAVSPERDRELQGQIIATALLSGAISFFSMKKANKIIDADFSGRP